MEDRPSSLVSVAKSDIDQQQAPTRMAAILENAGTVDVDLIFTNESYAAHMVRPVISVINKTISLPNATANLHHNL